MKLAGDQPFLYLVGDQQNLFILVGGQPFFLKLVGGQPFSSIWLMVNQK